MTYLTRALIEHLANLKAAGYELQVHWRWNHGDYHIDQSMNVNQIWFDDDGSIWFHTDVVFKIDATTVNVDEMTVLSPEPGNYPRWVRDWKVVTFDNTAVVSTGGQDA